MPFVAERSFVMRRLTVKQ